MISIGFIINGRIRSAKNLVERILDLQSEYGHDCIEAEITEYAGHATQIAQGYAHRQFDAIIACGGDGTINEVVNGLMTSDQKVRPALGVLPYGSANDFSRLFEKRSMREFILACKTPEHKSADVLALKVGSETRFSLNMTVSGIGAEIARTVNARKSWMWTAINYYTGIVQWLLTFQSPRVRISIDDQVLEQRTFLIAAGKGKYAGNGLGLLPHSSLDNGLISLCVIGDVNVLDFLRYQNSLKRCQKIDDPRVLYLQGLSISVEVLSRSLAVDTDGEFFARVPISGTLELTLEPRAIRLL